eukprot:TRINITY_DN3097_c0_g2_i1.p1 TRINITY_DN3097_c0_g2~~TRINITY_DN3097_c0_g2_i1.p1  ORF type:complete len:160 (-),score=19.84 TRINITY_DN3097_c0_g2_i1:169-615(-)
MTYNKLLLGVAVLALGASLASGAALYWIDPAGCPDKTAPDVVQSFGTCATLTGEVDGKTETAVVYYEETDTQLCGAFLDGADCAQAKDMKQCGDFPPPSCTPVLPGVDVKVDGVAATVTLVQPGAGSTLVPTVAALAVSILAVFAARR